MSDEEIGRLANRLAMLVSDDGEADNAGRAVGALARRLGISGGQIKAIFMAGMESAGTRSRQIAEHDAKVQTLTAELEQAREAQHRAEVATRSAMRERDALRRESEQLHAALDRRRTGTQVRMAIGVVVVAALAGGGWLALKRTDVPAQIETTAAGAGAEMYRNGIVHERNVAMRERPDTSAPAVATLTEGTHVAVRRTLWHNLQQWVEVEFDGHSGYVLSTEINLS